MSQYQLVIINGEKEEVVFISDNRLNVELRQERFIRSLTPGYAEIREVKTSK